MYSVKQIIMENWKSFLATHDVLYYQRREVEKMLDCSKSSCNSRICSSCGKRYTDIWSDNLKNELPTIPHKHAVLTVPSFLRANLKDWGNLAVLMRSAKDFFKSLI